jgi:hypothetical protein
MPKILSTPKILTVVHLSAKNLRSRVRRSLASAAAPGHAEHPVGIAAIAKVSSGCFREHMFRCIGAGEVRLRRTAHGPFYITGEEAASIMQAYLLATGRSFVHEADTGSIPPPRVSVAEVARANMALLQKHLAAVPEDQLAETLLAACREARHAEFLRLHGATVDTADAVQDCLVHDLRIENAAKTYCAAAIEEMLFERSVADALHHGLMPLHLMVLRGHLDRALDFSAVAEPGASAAAAQGA